jgi:hypothetical protein
MTKMVAIKESLAVALGSNLRDLYNLARSKLDGPTDQMIRALIVDYDEWHDREGAYAPKAGEVTGYRVEPEESVWRRAGDIKAGDRLDLEGDEYADTKDADGISIHASLEFEYYVVESVELETPDCVVFYSAESGLNCAFPVDHLVKFVRHDDDDAEGVDTKNR